MYTFKGVKAATLFVTDQIDRRWPGRANASLDVGRKIESGKKETSESKSNSDATFRVRVSIPPPPPLIPLDPFITPSSSTSLSLSFPQSLHTSQPRSLSIPVSHSLT